MIHGLPVGDLAASFIFLCFDVNWRNNEDDTVVTPGYQWVDGTGVDFVNWAEGQPDSHEGRESCVSADASNLKLYDSVCVTHMPFICEAPTGESQD
ncbi:C-type mannose receptor 2 [Portunus trituberculatus]|uniref:C-type mannose receptor 2 n=1 Tax=Portunus trituberculatus TaxID=210409 RepID=A0A5B7IKE3_PORTR|nr:C-type mannose receptor 2 [Portunus trituberculatus]